MKGLPARDPSRSTGVLLALLALALVLRMANAAWGSFKLDDFHSLHHARAADLAEFFRVLRQDNHPPLSFLLLRAARAAGGESPWGLRLPALVAGLGTLLLVWRLGRRLPCPRARGVAGLLLAASSLHVELSTDLRMYALLALASAGLLDGLLDLLEDGRGGWRVALWTLVGLHTHYHFSYALLLVGGGSLALALGHPPYRARRRALLAWLGLGGALSLPWYLLAFPAQLAHGLAPGGSDATLLRLGEGLKNLVFLNVSVGGSALRVLGWGASALLIALVLGGAASAWRRARADGRVALPVLLSLSALGVPALSWAAASLSPRAGYEWRYLSGSLAAFCLLAGAEACAEGALARARRMALAGVGLCAVLFAALNAWDPGEEDYRDAVAWVLAQSTSADAVFAADEQPLLFPQALAWDFYAARLAGGRALPERLEVRDTWWPADPGRIEGRARVFCCLRSAPPQCGILLTLRKAFGREKEVRVFGRSVFVHVFARP